MPPVLSPRTRALLQQEEQRRKTQPQQRQLRRPSVGARQQTGRPEIPTPEVESLINRLAFEQQRDAEFTTRGPAPTKELTAQVPGQITARLQTDINARGFATPYYRQVEKIEGIRQENRQIELAKQAYQAELNSIKRQAANQVQGFGGFRGINLGGVGKKRQRIIRAALAQQGVPYSWGGGGAGGKSRGIGRGARTVGFDCSGLVQFAYAKVGIQAPRVSYGQLRMGSRTAIRNLSPGDLVGFGDGHHVAIYLGNGRIVESPRTGLNVRVRKLSPNDYQRAWGVHINV